MSSTTDISQMTAAVAQLIGQPVSQLVTVPGGFNSRVYRVVCEGTPVSYVVKFYPENDSIHRDRLVVEFTGLEFMRAEGLRSVPEPIAMDRVHRCAVYGWIDGKKISENQSTDADLDQAVDFLLALKEIGYKDRAKKLPNAAEACFSVDDVLANIEERYQRFTELYDQNDVQQAQLRTFLSDEWRPVFLEIAKWCKSECRPTKISSSSQLPNTERSLSPSDFGFHNALKLQSGQLVFLDFEYFGWDDPAKMISDFLLHPGMVLNESHRARFTAAILSEFADYPTLPERLEIVYPLFGLKWCLIMLNRFLPQYSMNRIIDTQESGRQSESQIRQLTKARHMLQRITGEYETFPYRN